MKCYWLYILASKRNGTLYVGVTSDLPRRVYEHKEKLIAGFTKKYNITYLVYAEEFQDINDAIRREKCIKKWNRAWKLKLIEEQNPDWRDLYENII
ncbi:MAG: GIY-YIG nuclease family protein [Alphaproteobacteria bacterium]|jgi:putative endonuclease